MRATFKDVRLSRVPSGKLHKALNVAKSLFLATAAASVESRFFFAPFVADPTDIRLVRSARDLVLWPVRPLAGRTAVGNRAQPRTVQERFPVGLLVGTATVAARNRRRHEAGFCVMGDERLQVLLQK